MAKKKKEKVVLENIELKPQALGYTYQKKNNVGRVIFIFIAFILVVYFIDDISLFFNSILGKETAPTIENNANNTDKNNQNEPTEEPEIEYYSYSDDLKINFNGLSIDDFKTGNNMLTFDVNNLSQEEIDVANKKIFLETYDENKTLLDRFKLDINSVANNSKITLALNITKEFNYLTIMEKSIDDYPALTLNNNENGESTIVCTKDNETITYTFKEASLIKINDKIVDNDINNANYSTNMNNYQNKVNGYKTIEGIDANFISSLTGYTADINIDLAKTDLNKVNEKYYYAYHETAKVINYEMPTYGFTCNLM